MLILFLVKLMAVNYQFFCLAPLLFKYIYLSFKVKVSF